MSKSAPIWWKKSIFSQVPLKILTNYSARLCHAVKWRDVVTKFNLVASQTCVSPQHAESEMFIRGGLSGNFQKLFKYVGRLILLWKQQLQKSSANQGEPASNFQDGKWNGGFVYSLQNYAIRFQFLHRTGLSKYRIVLYGEFWKHLDCTLFTKGISTSSTFETSFA